MQKGLFLRPEERIGCLPQLLRKSRSAVLLAYRSHAYTLLILAIFYLLLLSYVVSRKITTAVFILTGSKLLTAKVVATSIKYNFNLRHANALHQ